MDGKWCAHILKAEGIGYCMAGIKSYEITPWTVCPICAAPRPKEPVKLAEKILNQLGIPTPLPWHEKLAQVALEHFRDIVNDSKHRGSLACFSKMDLLKRMEDSI